MLQMNDHVIIVDPISTFCSNELTITTIDEHATEGDFYGIGIAEGVIEYFSADELALIPTIAEPDELLVKQLQCALGSCRKYFRVPYGWYQAHKPVYLCAECRRRQAHICIARREHLIQSIFGKEASNE